MKYSLAFLALAGLISIAISPALAQTEQNFGPDIKYDPDHRFAMPVSKVTGLNNAKNVVIKEVTLSSLPDFMRIQAETLAETCTKSVDNKKLIKFYRYTSDATRDNALSASYLFDLAGLASKPQETCVLGNVCTKDGCFLVGYISTAYEKWSQHFFVRQKSWEHKKVDDPKTKATFTIFNLMTKCKTDASSDKDDKEGCLARRVWLERGFVEYKEGNMLDNVAPFVEPTPEEAPEQEASPDDDATPTPAPPADTSGDSNQEPPQ